MSDASTCARCDGPLSKASSEEDMMAEAVELFSAAELEDRVVVCDDCWREVMPHLPRIRAGMDQKAAALGITYDELLRRLSG